MDYVILNGKKSTLIKGLLIQSLPPISKPLMRTSIEEIDGRDGDIVTKLGYSAYDKEMSIGLFGDFDINEVIQYFTTEGTVVFSNESDKFYRFQIIEQIDFEKLLRFKTATVKFHCQPFKYSAVDDAVEFSINAMRLRVYQSSMGGISLSVADGLINIEGTATSDIQFYIPINKMNLGEGNYTLQAKTDGFGESAVKLRVIGNVPTDADSFGGSELQLLDNETATLSVEMEESKDFNYIWLYITKNTVIDFVLDLQMLNNDIKSFTLVNRGNTNSRPIFTIYGADNIGISINGELLFTIALGNAGYIVLDGEEMNAYKGDVFMNRVVTGDYENLSLKTGTNQISWTGNVNKIIIQNESRWI